MKKLLIGGLVGGIILFMWQFLSWAALNLHGAEMVYSDKQDEVLAALDGKLEPGHTYLLPNVAPGTDSGDMEAAMAPYQGKNWAKIIYRENFSNDMGMNMLRGFVVNFLAALLLTWLLMQFKDLTMTKSIIASLSIGTIGWFTVNYIDHIWFQTNTLAALLDVAVCYTLIGAFLGWLLNRK